VSERLHGERKCPACGRSRGIVKGGRKSSGRASIIWDEMPAYELGRMYTRKEIGSVLGGSQIEYLPTEDKRIVCGCFTLEHNPEAPRVVIPGTGRVIESAAKRFCAQDYPVPVFIKRKPNEWEYVGYFKVERYSTDPAEIAAHHEGSITPLDKITRVIFLKPSAMRLGKSEETRSFF